MPYLVGRVTWINNSISIKKLGGGGLWVGYIFYDVQCVLSFNSSITQHYVKKIGEYNITTTLYYFINF